MHKYCCLVAVACLLLGFSLTAFAAPESITCPELSVEVVLDETGSATILEHWTLTLPETVGNFSRTISVAQGQTLSDWELFEQKGAELNLPYTPITEASAEAVPSTLLLTPSDSGMNALWTFTPGEETRKFTLGYAVKNAVFRHADVADYTATFSDTTYPFSLESVRIQIKYPAPEEGVAPQAYLHGPLQSTIETTEEGTLLLVGNKVPANTALEVRALLSPTSFPQQKADEEAQKDTIIAEEQIKQQQAKTASKRLLLFWSILGILSLLILFAGWLVRRKVIRACARFATSNPGEPSFTPPQQLPPAALPDFYYFYSPKAKDLRGKRVVATLLDLFRRGILSITVKKDESLLARDQVIFVKQTDLSQDAPAYEKALLSLLFEIVAGGTNCCTMADLARYGQRNADTIGEVLAEFDGQSRRAFNACWFVDKTLSHKKRPALITLLIAFSLALTVLVLGGIFDPRLWVLVPALVTCGILAGNALFLRRLTAEGEEIFALWHTYRHFLKDFSEEEALPSNPLWEQTLINAAALGVLDRVLPQISERMADWDLPMAFPRFASLIEGGGMEAVLQTAGVFDSYPHARLHSYHED